MKILKYKTIENVKYVSKDIPITKKDIKIVQKKDDNIFDIFESKEYVYRESKKKDVNELLDNINKRNVSNMISELEEKLTNKDRSHRISNKTENSFDDDVINTRSVDISKEIDEDIYSDIKVNIEKSLEDDIYLDDPYKAAVKLSQEETKKDKNKEKSEEILSNTDDESIADEELLNNMEMSQKEMAMEIEKKLDEDYIKSNKKNEENSGNIEEDDVINPKETDSINYINEDDDNSINIDFEKTIYNNNTDSKKEIINLNNTNYNNKDNDIDIIEEETDSKKVSFKDRIINLYKNIFVHPEHIENKLSTWFDSSKKLAFLTALIVGLVTHITVITSTIMSQDGLWNSMNYSVPTDWEVALGRWGIFYVDKIFNYLAIPNLTTVIGIVLIAISALLIINLLKIKNKILVFISASALAVSPALTATFTYVYTSVAYCMAMFISVVIVCLVFKKNGKILNLIIATCLFTISLGIYQSYIGVTVGLAIIRLIRDLYDKDEKISGFFIHGIMILIVVIAGGLIYSQVTNNILESKEMNVASYKGMENISIDNTIKSLDKSIPNAYKDFEDFFFTDEIFKNTNYSRQEFFKVMFITTLILELIAIISNKIWKNPIKILFIILLTILLPIGLNSIDLLATDTKIYLLTGAQLILVIPFAMMICEVSGTKGTYIFKWASIISAFLAIFTYYLADNTSYMVLKLKYDQAINTTIRIMERVEEAEEYTPDKPIMIAGIIEENNKLFLPTHNLEKYTLGDIFDYPIFHGSYSGMEGTWTKFINTFMGINTQFCNSPSYNDIVDSIYFKEMNVFPEENSVKMIYGVMVVKLSDDPVRP